MKGTKRIIGMGKKTIFKGVTGNVKNLYLNELWYGYLIIMWSLQQQWGKNNLARKWKEILSARNFTHEVDRSNLCVCCFTIWRTWDGSPRKSLVWGSLGGLWVSSHANLLGVLPPHFVRAFMVLLESWSWNPFLVFWV